MFTTGLSSMSEKESSNRRKNLQMHDIKERPHINLPAIRGFLLQFSGKLQKHLKLHIDEIFIHFYAVKVQEHNRRNGSGQGDVYTEGFKFNLEKQLQAWRKKSCVSLYPKGFLPTKCESECGFTQMQYTLTQTIRGSSRIFIKVLLDEGSRQVVDLEQACYMEVFVVVIVVHVMVDQNREEIKLLRLLKHPDIVEIKHIMLPPSRREF
ncbi:hypothetical protein OSB04_013973 [Centaurea solstitialis]|uniref:Protein kinase domain-containing protein n=1 Tax=Centaurea solstitialis TaxID=347529 RepID=A0AA38TG16_9ASTR|nr:hypothetical protein OSB04_013973 [Centaurea solstitialis]